MNACAKPPVTTGWSATLGLEFQYKQNRTVLARNRHEGPLRVQRAFYPETLGQCHVYLLHPPGGIVAGDSLNIQADVMPQAHALITTPSAGRVYKSNQQRLTQTQQVNLRVASKGFCEWLPQENIVFNSAQAINQTRVELQGEAQFIGWEITCLGRPAAKEVFESGLILQSLELYRDQKPLLLEKNQFKGGSPLLNSRWGLNEATAIATMVCTLNNQNMLQNIKKLCVNNCCDQLIIEATQLPELLVVRAFAKQAEPIKNAFIDIWKQLRLHLLGCEAVAPRIWYT